MRIGRLVDNVGVLLLRQLTTWCLTLVLLRYLPRLLGADGLGKITFAASLMAMLLVVTNLGTGTYVTKKISVCRDEWSQLFWNTCFIRLGLGTLVLGVSALAINAMDISSTERGVLYLTGITLLVVAIGRTAEATIQGMEQMRWLSLSEIANKATTVLLGIGLLEAGYGVVTFAAAILIGSTVALVTNMVALLRFGLERPRFSPRIIRMAVVGGMPFLMATAVLQLYMWSDVTALQILTRDAVVGWYGAALQLYTTLNFLPLIFMTALLPPLSQMFANNQRADLLRLARNSLAMIFFASLPMAVGLGLLADRAIDLLGYPDEFGHSVTILRILAANLPLTGLLIILNTIITAMDQQARWVRIMAIALGLNLVLDVVLVLACDRFLGNGGIGAASAFLSAEVFQLLLATRIAPEGLLNRALFSQFARAGLATGVMAGVIIGAPRLGDVHTLELVVTGGIAYLVSVVMLGGLHLTDMMVLVREWLDLKDDDDHDEAPTEPREQRPALLIND